MKKPNTDAIDIVDPNPSADTIYAVTLDHVNTVIDEIRAEVLRLIEAARKASETPNEGYLGAGKIETSFPAWVHSQSTEIVDAVFNYVNYCNDQIGDALGHPKRQ